MTAQSTSRQLASELEALLTPGADAGTGGAHEAALEVVESLVRMGWVPPTGMLEGWAPAASDGPLSDGRGESCPERDAGTNQLARENPSTEATDSAPPAELSIDPALLAAMLVGPGVRSITEDFAVQRARQDGMVIDMAATRARVVAARDRSHRLTALVAAERQVRAEMAAARAERSLPPAAATESGDEDAAAERMAMEIELAQLRYALKHRPPTEHAVGMIMLALSCGPQTAWHTLIALSQTTNRRVRDIAESLAGQVKRGELRTEHLAAALADLVVVVAEDVPGD